MKAIILAAGFGRRLQPITNTMPKSMVPVGGTPLIIRSMTKIAKLGISEFVIVTGHMADYIKEHIGPEFNGIPVKYIENKDYQTTNNICSLEMAVDSIDDDTYLFECDLLYSEKLPVELSETDCDCSIVTSYFNKDTMDGTVIQIEEEDKAVNLILKKEQDENFDYSDKRKTVNIYKFKKDFFTKALGPVLKKEVAAGNVNSYYELCLREIILSKKWDIRVMNVPESYWCEIDDAEDLARAEKSDLL